MHSENLQIKDKTSGQEGFCPVLLKVEVSSDLLESGDELLVTAWWQNAGTVPAKNHYSCFMDIEFGHQRIMENIQKSYRIEWEPYPELHYWEAGEIHAITGRWRVPGIWGGTYRIYLGFCSDEKVPLPFLGENMKPVYRESPGEIDIGWGWGRPALELARKPWIVEFNEPFYVSIYDEEEKLRNKITISDEIAVTLDAHEPVLLGMEDSRYSLSLPCMLPEIHFRDKSSDRTIYSYQDGVSVQYGCEASGRDRVLYHAAACLNEMKIAQWALDFSIRGRRLEITLDKINEEKGFELLEVRLPSLVSVTGPGAGMIDFFMGGRLVFPDRSYPVGIEHVYDVRNAAAVYNSKAVFVVESENLDSRLFQSIQQNAGGRSAVIGIGLVARVRAYGNLDSIEVKGRKSVSVDMPDEPWGKPSWQTAARFLRSGLKASSPDIYRRALVYKYMLAYGPVPEPWQMEKNKSYPVQRLEHVRTFKNALDMVRRVHNLTDGVCQVVYLVGWQYEGHDTGYPYVLEVNRRAGTLEELWECMMEAKRYNALLSLHDNYDDAYPSAYFNPEIIAINERGNMTKGWLWAGGQSYIIGLQRYMKKGLMQERVKKTVEQYGIHTSYHLDVLTSEVRRYDYHPQWSASAEDELQAKFAVIDEFNKYGIDVTSEVLSHPFTGKVGFVCHTRGSGHSTDSLFPGDRPIPLTPMIYHGCVQYTASCQNEREMLRSIAMGAYASWDEGAEDIAACIRAYYIVTLPMGLLYGCVMENYTEEDGTIDVSYGKGSYVHIDLKKQEYEITVDGKTVGRNWTTFVPGFKKGSYLAFSLKGGQLCYPAPEGWANGKKLKAVALTADGEGCSLPCRIEAGNVVMNIPACTPVRMEMLD